MKKLFSLGFLTLVCFESQAQCYYGPCLTVRDGIYSGYNFKENQPIVGFFTGLQFCNIMLQIDVGWSEVKIPEIEGIAGKVARCPSRQKEIFYFNPALGVYFGKKIQFFGLVGLTSWPEYHRLTGDFKNSTFRWNFKAGMDVDICCSVFVNATWQYIINPTKNDWVTFANNALTVGVGYKF